MVRTLLLCLAIVVALVIVGPAPADAAQGVARRSRAPQPPARVDDALGTILHTNPLAPQRKHPTLASSLMAVGQRERESGKDAAIHQARSSGLAVRDDRVRVAIQGAGGDSSQVESLVRHVGGVVENAHGSRVEALVPPAALGRIGAETFVRTVEPARRLTPTAVTGEEVAASGANVWQNLGANGSGVKIAVLDGDFQGYQQRQASGDLPTNLKTVNHCPEGLENGLDEGHGTAVAEIVHEMAPAAELFLVCAGTLGQTQQALSSIYANGIQIVNHSRAFFNASRGDGAIPPASQAFLPEGLITDAFNHGLLWVNAAGNSADVHWSGTFVDSSFNAIHDFTPTDEGNTITIPQNGTVAVYLKWDSWPVTAQDYDLFLVRSSDGDVVALSVREQSGNAPPTEDLFFTNTGPTAQFAIAIVRFNANLAPRMDLFVEGNTSALEYVVPAGSLNDFSVSPRALIVGAACWQNQQLQAYSSRGPTIDGRVKPDITGLDSISSATFGPTTGCPSSPTGFSGTSAAAPHVAAAAALTKDVSPQFIHTQLQFNLEQSAIDKGPSGKDPAWGAGLLAFYPLPLPAVACSPRPAITLASAVQSGVFAVTVRSTGAGNRLLKLIFGAPARPLLNAKLSFPDGRANVTGAATAYTAFGSTQATFGANRQNQGIAGMTVPMIAADRCGAWQTFVGAGGGVPGF